MYVFGLQVTVAHSAATVPSKKRSFLLFRNKRLNPTAPQLVMFAFNRHSCEQVIRWSHSHLRQLCSLCCHQGGRQGKAHKSLIEFPKSALHSTLYSTYILNPAMFMKGKGSNRIKLQAFSSHRHVFSQVVCWGRPHSGGSIPKEKAEKLHLCINTVTPIWSYMSGSDDAWLIYL